MTATRPDPPPTWGFKQWAIAAAVVIGLLYAGIGWNNTYGGNSPEARATRVAIGRATATAAAINRARDAARNATYVACTNDPSDPWGRCISLLESDDPFDPSYDPGDIEDNRPDGCSGRFCDE